MTEKGGLAEKRLQAFQVALQKTLQIKLDTQAVLSELAGEKSDFAAVRFDNELTEQLSAASAACIEQIQRASLVSGLFIFAHSAGKLSLRLHGLDSLSTQAELDDIVREDKVLQVLADLQHAQTLSNRPAPRVAEQGFLVEAKAREKDAFGSQVAALIKQEEEEVQRLKSLFEKSQTMVRPPMLVSRRPLLILPALAEKRALATDAFVCGARGAAGADGPPAGHCALCGRAGRLRRPRVLSAGPARAEKAQAMNVVSRACPSRPRWRCTCHPAPLPHQPRQIANAPIS